MGRTRWISAVPDLWALLSPSVYLSIGALPLVGYRLELAHFECVAKD